MDSNKLIELGIRGLLITFWNKDLRERELIELYLSIGLKLDS